MQFYRQTDTLKQIQEKLEDLSNEGDKIQTFTGMYYKDDETNSIKQ